MHAIIDGGRIEPQHGTTPEAAIRLRIVAKVVMDDGDVVPYESEPIAFTAVVAKK